jgi:hypothetical protein
LIACSIYFVALCFLIYKTALFGILKDEILNRKFYLSAFIVKCTGVFFFWLVYVKFYGGLNYSDTGNFFRDAKIIHSISQWDVGEFLKVIFGFQNEGEETELFKRFTSRADSWNQAPGEILYNDNRILIKLHALICFISFGNYFVHALFSCLVAFIGINWIYTTFKFLFPGKEIYLFLCWLVFPGLWFWSSGILKESLALFFMGLLLISLKRIVLDQQFRMKNWFMLLIGIIICFFFKQYVILPLLFCSLLFFIITSRENLKRKSLIFLSALLLIAIMGNFSLNLLFNRNLLSILEERQRVFKDVAKGGIFLQDQDRWIRLPYNYDLVNIDSSGTKPLVTIKKNASFVYLDYAKWPDSSYCASNTDTTRQLSIQFILPEARSTIQIPSLDDSWFSLLKVLPSAVYISILKPFFFDSRNVLDHMTSFENLLIIASILILLVKGRAGPLINWIVYFCTICLII